jgi:hypothetical protein
LLEQPLNPPLIVNVDLRCLLFRLRKKALVRFFVVLPCDCVNRSRKLQRLAGGIGN